MHPSPHEPTLSLLLYAMSLYIDTNPPLVEVLKGVAPCSNIPSARQTLAHIQEFIRIGEFYVESLRRVDIEQWVGLDFVWVGLDFYLINHEAEELT